VPEGEGQRAQPNGATPAPAPERFGEEAAEEQLLDERRADHSDEHQHGDAHQAALGEDRHRSGVRREVAGQGAVHGDDQESNRRAHPNADDDPDLRRSDVPNRPYLSLEQATLHHRQDDEVERERQPQSQGDGGGGL
jgi:hypothetical protein